MNLKRIARVGAKKILLGSGALRLASRFTSPRAVILGYHSIQNRPELYADSLGLGITHATSVFESQMELVAHKYNPVSLQEILLFLRGERKLPRNAVAVTFDDGYQDNFRVAEPILRRFGIPATFYLTVCWIGSSEAPWFCQLRHAFATTNRDEWSDPVRGQRWKLSDPKSRSSALLAAFDICSSMSDVTCRAMVRSIGQDLDVATLALNEDLMMTWEQARRLHNQGHTIGSHTMTHPNVAHLSDEQVVRTELTESKRQIEQRLNVPVAHFSYPHPGLHPQWTQRTVRISRETGYQTAVTTTGGPVRSEDDPLTLTRLIAPRFQGHFRWALESAFLGHAA